MTDDAFGRKIRDRYSHLLAVKATPDEALPVLGDGDGVVRSTLHGGDALLGESSNLLGSSDDGGLLVTLPALDACLGVIVEAPSVHFVLVVNSEAVVLAGCNELDLLLVESRNEARDEAGVLIALVDLPTKLVLFAAAPSPDVSLAVESKSVIGSASDVSDLLELFDEDRLLLDFGLGVGALVEAECAVGVLG